MERLLLRLVLGLLKLVFQLIVFVATGSWLKFERRTAADAPAGEVAKSASSKRTRGRAAPPGRVTRPPAFMPAPAAPPEAPWPFEFAAELSDPEPYVEEGRANEARLAERAARRTRAKLSLPALTSARAARRSLSSAVRDRRTVREALVLGAALAPRTPPRRRP